MHKTGNYLLATDHRDTGDVYILDISDPSSIAHKSTFESEGSVFGMWTNGTMVYMANYEEGILAVDITNPQNPRLNSQYDSSGQYYDVYSNDEHIYCANGESGLEILDYTP